MSPSLPVLEGFHWQRVFNCLMLQLQIFHLKRRPEFIEIGLNFGSLIKIMEKTRNKSELRVFIKMCRELVSRLSYRNLELEPLKYMVEGWPSPPWRIENALTLPGTERRRILLQFCMFYSYFQICLSIWLWNVCKINFGSVWRMRNWPERN